MYGAPEQEGNLRRIEMSKHDELRTVSLDTCMLARDFSFAVEKTVMRPMPDGEYDVKVRELLRQAAQLLREKIDEMIKAMADIEAEG